MDVIQRLDGARPRYVLWDHAGVHYWVGHQSPAERLHLELLRAGGKLPALPDPRTALLSEQSANAHDHIPSDGCGTVF